MYLRYQYLDYTKKQLFLRIEELETLNQELKELAELDSLTKISNQRALLNFLNSEITMTDKNPLCIALFDIDDFKRINDTMGHVYGNEVLCKVAKIIQNDIRKADLAGRYGGWCGRFLGPTQPFQNYGLYSSGLMPPRDSLMRVSLYHL